MVQWSPMALTVVNSCHLPEKLETKLLGLYHLANQDLVLNKSETTITKLIGNLTDSYPTWLISNSKGKPLLAQLQFIQISGTTRVTLPQKLVYAVEQISTNCKKLK